MGVEYVQVYKTIHNNFTLGSRASPRTGFRIESPQYPCSMFFFFLQRERETESEKKTKGCASVRRSKLPNTFKLELHSPITPTDLEVCFSNEDQGHWVAYRVCRMTSFLAQRSWYQFQHCSSI